MSTTALDSSAHVGTQLHYELQAAIENAERLLTRTIEGVNPGTPAATLLACVAIYRSELAALVAVCRQHDQISD